MKKKILILSVIGIVILGCEKQKIEKDFYEKKIDTTKSEVTTPTSDTTPQSSITETPKDTKSQSKIIKDQKVAPSNQVKKNTSSKKVVETKKVEPKKEQISKVTKATGKKYNNIGEALKTLGDLLAKDKNKEAVNECNRIIANPSIVPDIKGNIDSFHYFRLSAWFKMKDYLRVKKECDIFDKKFPNSKYASGVNGLRQGVDAMIKAGLVK